MPFTFLLLENDWLRPILSTIITLIILKVCRRLWPQPKVRSMKPSSSVGDEQTKNAEFEKHLLDEQRPEDRSENRAKSTPPLSPPPPSSTSTSSVAGRKSPSPSSLGCFGFVTSASPCKGVDKRIRYHHRHVDRGEQKSDREKRAAARGEAELERFMLGF
ncbi:hypothetical protein FOL47_000136 [Perkinsus chesapeaki]|uniref:Uncharacterized protein n=1 Tax=Perkinsus chesapeaki TaxID=330153 RepID=A0A7J6N200_PERCH|nr:hypothetical protein FOL47_000136 [Perkinsus chesapeaki]